MKITVLAEDGPGPEGLICEHGLSLYIETAKHRLIADTGASPLTWENAEKLGINPENADAVFLSHAHYDHSGGIMSFREYNTEARIFLQESALGGYYHDEKYIGVDPKIVSLPVLCFTGERYVLDDEISFFSNITGRRRRPQSNLILSELKEGIKIPDSFRHEQCLVIECDNRKTLISGCAHSGILNILDKFRSIYRCSPDVVISGFHMIKDGEYSQTEIDDVESTAAELAETDAVFYTGHCTGHTAFEIMKPLMGEKLHKLYPGKVIEL